EILLRLLEFFGYPADCAANGLEAVTAFRAEKYDLILMDLQMPVMDGLEATRRLREESPGPRPRIVAVTAHAMAGDRERCLAQGMDGYLSKPVQLEHLRAALDEAEAAFAG
ncbi:MAG: response regulator, partial [Holophagales bacterium]|nr:response regulator [Holophagales bacterium]